MPAAGGGGEDKPKRVGDKKMRAQVEAVLSKSKPAVRWDEVAGQAGAKRALQEAVRTAHTRRQSTTTHIGSFNSRLAWWDDREIAAGVLLLS